MPLSMIKGGKETKMCEWATTVWLRNCTATLIHPRVVIYAAHCGSRIRSVFFGEESNSKGSVSPKVKFCKTNPKYTGSHVLGKGEDYAFCLLEEPINDMPIAPIGYGCELEHVNPKNPVWLVGFGLNDNKEGRPKQGVKRMVKTNIGRKSKDGTEIELGRLGFVSSSGDSGGPAYVKLEDGTWRTVGITSWGAGPGPNWYVSAAHAVPWIHKTLTQEGYDDIDITPCFDDDGTWNPSTECGGFALDPGTAYGTYKEQCAVKAPLSGASSTCGAPNPEAKGGVKTPIVKVSSPEEGAKYEQGEKVKVEVKLQGVPKGKQAQVTLSVEGDDLEEQDKAPYLWTLKELEPGRHRIMATAQVEGQDEPIKSETLTIEVKSVEKENTDTPGDPSPGPTNKEDGPKSSPEATDEKNSESGSVKQSSNKSGSADDEGRGPSPGCNSQGSSPRGLALGLFGLSWLMLRRRARFGL